jgi:small subunit ribosomal protein S17
MIGNRRKLVGRVVSNSMDKSVVVRVDRQFRHRTFKKYITRWKKYLAHDEKNECNVGDTVQILECRPLSRRKCWAVLKILERAQ